jgi:tRNA(Ile)-lysidine synthase
MFCQQPVATFIKTVRNSIKHHQMIQNGDDTVLVGVSGGIDSVALLHVLRYLAFEFHICIAVAHLNHGLRQQESERDARFVQSLAKSLGLPYFIDKCDTTTYAKENKLTKEEAARHLRYAFYDRISQQQGFEKIALGHHKDDTSELVLMNLFRGSGPLGLSGIPPVRDAIIRPLIDVSREQILSYVNAAGYDYINDSSNTDIEFLRNRIRHRLLPVLKKEYNPSVGESLNRLANVLRYEEDWIESIIQSYFKKIKIDEDDQTIIFSVEKLKECHIAPVRRIIRKGIQYVKGDLRKIRLFHLAEAVDLLKDGKDRKKMDLPDRVFIQRHGDRLIIGKQKKVRSRIGEKTGERLCYVYEVRPPCTVLVKEIGKRLTFSFISVEKAPAFDVSFREKQSQDVGYFDLELLRFPLTVRNFHCGDRFRPLGLSGSQKVKDFFINNKVPYDQRAQCPILESCGKIIWVVGFRIDDSVRISASTKKILKVRINEHI